VFRAIARLENYRLEFDRDKSEVWRGASATITESPGDHVWGVVWTMNKADLASLDIQEGVDSGIYEVCIMFCRI
jgi:gamma-glutamylcyclotransferase